MARREIEEIVNMLTGETPEVDSWDSDLDKAEDYLLKKAVCDEDGNLLFTDKNKFKQFKENISPDVVNEIMVHIKCMNELYGDFDGVEDVIDSYKKKQDA